MRIIEQFVRGKTGDDALSEDVIAVTGDFAAVIDGATSRHGQTLGGMTPGRFAAVTIAGEIGTLPPGIAMEDTFARFTAAVAQATDAAGGGDAHGGFTRPSAAVLVYSRARREIWRVADSTFLLDGRAHYRFFPQEAVLSDMRRILLTACMEKGATVAQLREKDPAEAVLNLMWPDLRAFANSAVEPYGFGVVSGGNIPAKYLERFSTGGAREIVLASDGYPEVFPTLVQSEAALEKVIAEDPLMMRLHPQVKGVKAGAASFDDRSYLRFSV